MNEKAWACACSCSLFTCSYVDLCSYFFCHCRPGAETLGLYKGEPYYLRADVSELHTAEKWITHGLEVLLSELGTPAKVVAKRGTAGKQKKQKMGDAGEFEEVSENPFLNDFDYFRMTIQYTLDKGNAFSERFFRERYFRNKNMAVSIQFLFCKGNFAPSEILVLEHTPFLIRKVYCISKVLFWETSI